MSHLLLNLKDDDMFSEEGLDCLYLFPQGFDSISPAINLRSIDDRGINHSE
jgi:hypothetical protein